jgi:uncharacterized paraquat-inducible protein A
MSRIECKTAAQCEQLVTTMETTVGDWVVLTVIVVVAVVVLYRMYSLTDIQQGNSA